MLHSFRVRSCVRRVREGAWGIREGCRVKLKAFRMCLCIEGGHTSSSRRSALKEDLVSRRTQFGVRKGKRVK